MYLYKKTLCPKNKAGKISALLLLLGGFASFFLSNADLIALPSLAQTLGVVMIAGAIYIATTYLLREYTVSVELSRDGGSKESPEYEFRIDERRSRMTYTVCRIWLSEIEQVRVMTPKNKKQIKTERKKKKRYRYDTTFAPSQRIEIIARIDDEELSVLVTYDEDLLKALRTD